MALTKLELDTIRRGCRSAQIVLETLKPLIDELNVIYDSEGGVKSTIQQTDLDAETSLSEITKQQLDDGMYALTNGLKTAIDSAVSQLAQLSARV